MRCVKVRFVMLFVLAVALAGCSGDSNGEAGAGTEQSSTASSADAASRSTTSLATQTPGTAGTAQTTLPSTATTELTTDPTADSSTDPSTESAAAPTTAPTDTSPTTTSPTTTSPTTTSTGESQPTTVTAEQCHTGLPTLQVTRASNSQAVALELFISKRATSVAFRRTTETLSGFVGTRPGYVYAFSAPAHEPGTPTKLARSSSRAAIDLSTDTGDDFELGLLGMTFGPNEKWLYLYRVTPGPNWHSVLTAHAVSGDTLGPAVEILRMRQPFPNHNGGDIVFGPDGYLFMSLGDGGSQEDPSGNGQNLATPFGSILRLAVDPTAPAAARAVAAPGNPYIGTAGVDDRIWVSGVRNPFRITYDQVGRQLWVADVGEACMEEITVLDLSEAGADLGWNVFEGNRRLGGEVVRPHREPDFAYRQKPGTLCAVIGGPPYRGTALPGLAGHFIWADLCARRIYASVLQDSFGSQRSPVAVDLGVSAGEVWGLVAGPAGEVYVLDRDFGVSRIVPAAQQ